LKELFKGMLELNRNVKDERTRGEKDIQVIRDEGKKEKEKGNP
jgi:hypothetical protein